MDIECPQCKSVLEGDDSVAGKNVRCPQCNTEFAAPPTDTPPLPPSDAPFPNLKKPDTPNSKKRLLLRSSPLPHQAPASGNVSEQRVVVVGMQIPFADIFTVVWRVLVSLVTIGFFVALVWSLFAWIITKSDKYQ